MSERDVARGTWMRGRDATIGGIVFAPSRMQSEHLLVQDGLYGMEIIHRRSGFYWHREGRWVDISGTEKNINFDDSELDAAISAASRTRFPRWSGTQWSTR